MENVTRIAMSATNTDHKGTAARVGGMGEEEYMGKVEVGEGRRKEVGFANGPTLFTNYGFGNHAD